MASAKSSSSGSTGTGSSGGASPRGLSSLYLRSTPAFPSSRMQPYKPDVEELIKRLMKDQYRRQPDKPMYDFSQSRRQSSPYANQNSQAPAFSLYHSPRTQSPFSYSQGSQSCRGPKSYSERDKSYDRG